MSEISSPCVPPGENAPRLVDRMYVAAKILSPLLVVALILVAFNSLLFRVTNFYYWVKPNSTMGLTVHMQDVVLHQIVPGKKNIIVIGDSRVAEGFSAVIANRVANRPDINFIQAGIPAARVKVLVASVMQPKAV
jgi:hypothetical protein